MKIKAEITVSDNKADALFNAVKPEAIDRERTQLKIKKEKNKIVMDIDSEDAVAFRATLNSVSQMLAVFEKMESIGKKTENKQEK